MAAADAVIEYIRTALANPLVSANEVISKHRFKMPLDWYRNQPSEWHMNQARRPFVYRNHDPLKRELSSLIKRGFGHFAANPSRAGNVAAHQKTYVLAGGDEEYEDPESARPVNWNSAAVDEFVQSLIQAASKARSLYEERYYPQRSEQQDLSTEKLHLSPLMKWALLGERGVGKTAFLNYVLATRTIQLHSKRVIWVRIDLTKEYEERLTLENIIHWQTLQILFRYYDLTKRNEDVHKLGPGDEKHIMLFYGLRLVQLFDAEASSIDKDEAMEFLLNNFGYDDEILECAFDELMDAGVLSYVPSAEFTFPNTIELTNRGRYLNRRLLNSIEYLNLALQAAPLPAYLVDQGLFPIRRYACSEYALFNKIICTTNFVRFAKQLEAQEEQLFNRTLGATTSFSYRRYKAGKFAFVEELTANILGSIEHMVRGAWDAGGPLKMQFERLVSDDLLGVR